MRRSLTLVCLAAALGCAKKEEAAQAPKPAEPAPQVQNAVTQKAADLQNNVNTAQGAQAAANAALKQNADAVQQAGGDGDAQQ